MFSTSAKRVGAASLALVMTGCAGVSPQKFNENPSAASAYEICKALADNPNDKGFVDDLRLELMRRNVDEAACSIVIEKRKNAVAAGIVGGLAVLAVVAAARNGGGGAGAEGSSYVPAAPVSDHAWEWDEYYRNGVLVWSCRGVQTGQYADNSRCAYKVKSDWKWPSKQAF